MSSFLSKIFGDPNARFVKKFQPLVDQINQLEKKFEGFSDTQIKERAQELRRGIIGHPEAERSEAEGSRDSSPSLIVQAQNDTKKLDDILPEVFALVREAAKRTIKQRHFDEQLMAGIILHRGMIAEQKTGEGKTLSATLAVALNALTGKGVHLVTVNDYLARRDANWMGPIYYLLGLSVACINHDKSYLFAPQDAPDNNEVTVEMQNMKEVARKEAYAADITYGTNNEFGFDYLRDNLAQDLTSRVQRGYNFAIVDEVDSILIDEARTPLIISAPDEESTKLYQTFSHVVPRLKKDEDYEVDEKMRAVSILDSGIDKVEKALGIKNIYDQGGVRYVHQLEQALRASVLFKRDRDYLVKNNEVLIIDEFTGRLMPGRRYSEGLHQALEAKEGVQVQQESRTLASITFQNYFRLYKKLAGMTGTALSSAEEFDTVYKLRAVAIPTHRSLTRQDLSDRIYRTEKAKFQAITKQIKECRDNGQPVLVGTRSVERNEYLSALLSREGIAHEVLNAKNHEREAQIIAQAGRSGAVTVATNMAGRGVDIVLGGKQIGDPTLVGDRGWQKLHKQVIEAGGLFILGTERHEARRIDDQLRGRAGRQGDPGISVFFVSLEDELMRIFAGDRLKNVMTMLKVPDDMPIENRMISRAIESAQFRIEGYNFDSRKHTLEYDDVLNKQRQYIYGQRQRILQSEGLKEQVLALLKNEISRVVKFYTQEVFDSKGILEALNNFLPIIETQAQIENDLRAIIDERADSEDKQKKIIDYFDNLCQKLYSEREASFGVEQMQAITKFVLLRSYDIFWMEHLDNMEHLRQSVALRAYAQRDPLVEYKNEGAKMFKRLLAAIQAEVVNLIFKIQAQPQSEVVVVGRPALSEAKGGNLEAGVTTGSDNMRAQLSTPSTRNSHGKKPGRNDPCLCGSGKKYKKCCGK
ncbi:MAG: preprotein translocase subunit SecA [Candidatus Portnoybacteria bacterium CG_4_10_14_0_2_um_filter_39_11]|uniref:Protein translocase subunit SecA n=1 Tax=Candidatus Portnoybacteria bacterium CG_4_10_14_0_2_um_filter_39_11 TaxID=1974797 RepID=A0A2M7UHQ9_9BACT|nr:MAG: preprotein translocase subunit SecA [Parcubacteria group bacterium CG1_02_40_25]PIZ70748.1 MAG: preprotein translocase subunit SecA [Candidatus Portnoybacteria bacterium CG_4_10_14_0_2_um_filter_39_11]